MKINSIQRDIALKQGGSGMRSQVDREKQTMSAIYDTRGYNAEYCGSFTGKSEAATSFLDKILKSNWFGKFAQYSDAHNISTSALIALILAGILRPATIMSLPGDKDKEDKIYASGHAIASGILGFAFSTAITSPFDLSIKKIFDDKKYQGAKFKALTEKIAELKGKGKLRTAAENAEYHSLKLVRETMRTLIKNLPDWAIAVPRAMLTIALIPPILKYVFGVEKKKKQKPVEAATQQNVQQAAQQVKPEEKQAQKYEVSQNFIEKPVFSAFKGGVQ